MHLTDEQAQQFYDIWLPFMFYLHERKNEDRNAEMDLFRIHQLSKDLCKDVSLIDDYIEDNPSLSDIEIDILHSWKNIKQNYFFIYKHLKNGSILISDEKYSSTYQVIGLFDDIADLMQDFSCPIICETTLLPFCGKIITNGVMLPENVVFGPNIKKDLKNRYDTAKKEHRIISSLE